MMPQLPSPLTNIQPDWPGADSLTLYVKRDDLIHPIISGNKWRKLRPLLEQSTKPPTGIVSFGGGYSNHLHALGYVCAERQIPFVAIVRGNYLDNPTPMLRDLDSWGATIRYVTKQTYRERGQPEYLDQLSATYPDYTIIPEGGSQRDALKGVAALVDELPMSFDAILSPVASGATLAGLSTALKADQQAIGIAVLNGERYLESLVSSLLPQPNPRWKIVHQYHHGGYAKTNAMLGSFCRDFEVQTGIPVEPVYSGKLFFALKGMIADGIFAPGQTVVALHTGGLQGARQQR